MERMADFLYLLALLSTGQGEVLPDRFMSMGDLEDFLSDLVKRGLAVVDTDGCNKAELPGAGTVEWKQMPGVMWPHILLRHNGKEILKFNPWYWSQPHNAIEPVWLSPDHVSHEQKEKVERLMMPRSPRKSDGSAAFELPDDGKKHRYF